MRSHIAIAIAVLISACLGTARAADLNVSGKVTDADVKPVAGAEVAWFWFVRDGAMQPSRGVTSDAAGRFKLVVPDYNPTVLAFDKERRRGALVTVDKAAAAKEVTLKLGPLVRVKGNFFCKEANLRPTWTNVYVMTSEGRGRVLMCDSREAKFSFLLPPGKYKFWGYGSDVQDHRQDLTVSADKPELDMQTVDLPATAIARHKGKAPPAWHVTDARGVKKDVTLADFKGKWVLVEFWGFW